MRETIYGGKSYREADYDVQKAVAAGGINLFRYFPQDRLIIVAETTAEKFSCKRFYPDMPQSFAQEMVYGPDRTIFLDMYQAIGRGEKKATAVFKLRNGVTVVRVVLSVLEVDGNGKALTVVGMAEDVTEEITREREGKIREQVLHEEQARLASINRALSSNFNNVYLVDLADGNARSYSISDVIKKEYGDTFNKGDYGTLIQIYVKKSVYKPDQELFGHIIDAECLKAAVWEKGSDTFNYRVARDGEIQYFQCRAVRAEIENKDYCVIAFRDIHAEVMKELEQKARLRDALAKSERYKHAVLAEAMIAYEINLSKNLIEEEMWESIDGIRTELLSVMGMSVPADYDVFHQRWASRQVISKYREIYEKRTDRTYLLRQFKDGCTESTFEFQSLAGNGKKLYMRHTISMVQDKETGDIIAYCNVKNITEQKLKEQQMHQHEQLFILTAANIYKGVLQVELDTQMTRRILIRNGELIVEDVGSWDEYLAYQLSFVHPDDFGMVANALSIRSLMDMQVSEKSICSYKGNKRNEAGNYRSFFTNTYMAEVDGRRYGIVVTIDNTKAVERELRQKKLIEDALARAEVANKAKTAFLSNMSHDIRTPMNAVIGYTTLAATHIDNKEQVQDYLGKIMSASNHLLSLINDVLDMSRIESGRIQLEEAECSLAEIMHELRNILQNDMKSKGLDFYIDMADVFDENVICDRLRLNQILLNILGNAIKFTEPGGSISVCISQKPADSKEIGNYEFHVKDTGIGMSGEFLRHIFEPFERERNSTVSGIQGTGLGMPITKSFVGMMGGTIEVKSRKGEGTEFIVILPLKILKKEEAGIKGREPGGICTFAVEFHPKEAEDRAKLSGRKDISGKRLLLVEDNELNREIASEILSTAGFIIEEAENGKIAVERLAEKGAGYYDLVLMDVQMPVMDGYEATREIRALEEKGLADIPIIAMTANAFEEDKRKALETGMNAHIAKPINVKELLDTLGKLL